MEFKFAMENSGLTLAITDDDRSEEPFGEICARSKPTWKSFPQQASNRAEELAGQNPHP
jgi:hypothetical protein